MNRTVRHALAALAAGLAFSASSFAQDVKREEMVSYFATARIDKNHDQMVSKKEFMDMMAKAWDMKMAAMPKGEMKAKDKMTLEQYTEFARMFNLNVGG